VRSRSIWPTCVNPSSQLAGDDRPPLRTGGIRGVSCSPDLSREASYDEDRLSERLDLNSDKAAVCDKGLSLVGVSRLNHLHDRLPWRTRQSTVVGHAGGVKALAYSPDSRYAAAKS